MAAVTIGKDMTLRDYKQGCWRMRGLGKGQRVHVFIVQEVYKLICDAVVTTGKPAAFADSLSLQTDVLAWLTLNSIKSEALQQLHLHKQVHGRACIDGYRHAFFFDLVCMRNHLLDCLCATSQSTEA